MARIISYDSDNLFGESAIRDLIDNEPKLVSWTAIWSLHIAKHQHKKVGQSDFVLIGPLGIMVIEVKGDTHHEFPASGGFRWGDPSSTRPFLSSNETPFQQASNNMFSIKKVLENTKAKSLVDQTDFCYAAAFPYGDVSFLKNKQHIQYESFQIWDSGSKDFYNFILQNFEAANKKRSLRNGPSKKLSGADINFILSFLAVDAKTIIKKNRVAEIDHELIRLQDEQCHLYDQPLQRICIEGGPGTGKSIGAEYIANKLIAEEKSILWISFNRIFTDYIKKKFAGNGRINVQKSTAWMMGLIRENGMEVTMDDPRLMEKFAESALELSMNNLIKQYDAVIIDEAQDILTKSFYEGLDFIIKDGWKEGSWYIFLDSNIQAEVYDRLDDETLDIIKTQAELKIPLTINYRNAKEVISEAASIVGIETPSCKSKIKGGVQYFRNTKILDNSDSTNNKNFFEDTVVEILESGVRDPIVLSYQKDKNFLSNIDALYLKNKNSKKYYFLPYAKNETQDGTPIKFCNISSFKGMEAVDIIIYWPLQYWDSNFRGDLIYTALSRAFNRAYIILEDYDPDSLLVNTHDTD